MNDLKNYIFGEMNIVRGYMHPSDALLFSAILFGQNKMSIAGPVAEIGVFFGRSFFLLAKIVNDVEKVVGMDLFDIGPTREGGTFQRSEFERMASKLGVDLSLNHIIQGDTAEIDADSLLSLVGPIRFFHIDGGHRRFHVLTDSNLAIATTVDGAVICFDDFFNPEWPEVTAQVFDLLRDNDHFQPFAATAQKLYVCRKDYAIRYQKLLDDSVLTQKLGQRKTSLDGHNYKIFEDNIFRKIRYRILARSPFCSINSMFY
jgi:hypothetical protein